MSDDASPPAIRVSAHVLIQLGSELVTDIDQAILEAVKNAYDADSLGCTVEIDTEATGTFIDEDASGRYVSFVRSSATVQVELRSGRLNNGQSVGDVEDDDVADCTSRALNWRGSIVISDKGDGLSPEQIRNSWLVVSGSAKRSAGGPKRRTRLGRTPLGDKGLGRLGTMRLGDILEVESATSPEADLTGARFRWTDCEDAETVDQVPVTTTTAGNRTGFKGTRVSVFGLNELASWRRPGRGVELARGLARLVSPFEATSTFPVTLFLNQKPLQLDTVTADVLKRAVARFEFWWEADERCEAGVLRITAHFQRRLLTGSRSSKKRGLDEVLFARDNGEDFLDYFKSLPRIRERYEVDVALGRAEFLSLTDIRPWAKIYVPSGIGMENPGSFSGEFYYFHLDDLGEADPLSATGVNTTKDLVKGMAGIAILRDGFRIRSSGDWLDLASGMTSGSTYNMRVNNTLGFFALSGEHNHRLIEKSDREGFVEDAVYAGFHAIALACRKEANNALENVRRAGDAYYKTQTEGLGAKPPPTTDATFKAVEEHISATAAALAEADAAAATLKSTIVDYETSQDGRRVGDIAAVRRAAAALVSVQERLAASPDVSSAVRRLREADEASEERASALYESAAVGISAKGLAHELRTQLDEIRFRTDRMQKLSVVDRTDRNVMPHIRAIRGCCTLIGNSASLLDPLMPRGRAFRENLSLFDVASDYAESRRGVFDGDGITLHVTDRGGRIKVKAVRARLLQVLDNLVQNARYWLKRGDVMGSVARPKRIEVVVDGTTFSVSDTGPGVDPKYESSLFDIFVTSKPEGDDGQGLGLFIIRHLVQLDGGDVFLAPERNEDGRRFRFVVDTGLTGVAG